MPMLKNGVKKCVVFALLVALLGVAACGKKGAPYRPSEIPAESYFQGFSGQ